MASPSEAALRRDLLLLTLAGFFVRAAFLVLEPATRPVADELTWIDMARTLSDRGFSPRAHIIFFYPPLYPYVLAAAQTFLGGLEAVKWVQALLAAGVIPAVGYTASYTFGPRAGVLAAGFAAFYPELVWFSVHFWSESLFLLLLWWGLERLMAAEASGRTRHAVAAGVVWAVAILCRETVLYFLLVAAAWLALGRCPSGRAVASRAQAAAAFLLTAVLVIAPWTWRNWVVFRAFVPVATSGSLNLYQGNAPLSRQEVYDERDAVQGKAEQHRFLMRRGLEAVRDRQPTWLFEKLVEQMPMFWEAESMAVIHVKRGAYGPVSPAGAIAVALVFLLPYLAVLGLFVLGVAAAPFDRRSALLLAFLAYYNLIHVVTHGFNRYRLPVMPVLFVFAAEAWRLWRTGPRPLLSPARRALAAVLALVLGLSIAPSIRVHLGHPAFGLRGAAGAAPPE